MSDAPRRGLRTRAIHAGEPPDPATGATAPNIVVSTNFVAPPDAVGFTAGSLDEDSPYFYSRWSNPTVRQLEQKLAALEGGEDALALATGMGAVSALLLHLLKPGDHLVVTDVGYAGTADFTRDNLPRLGVEVTAVDLTRPDELRAALRPGRTRLVLAETPANPILRLTDIAEVAAIAHDAGAELAVDSTFATPVATRPLELGADYVYHSLTKYVSGHGDVLGGAIVGGAERMMAIRRDTGVHVGATMSPFAAWLVMRGAATLPLRMAAHSATALELARALEGHPRVQRVLYPGLPSHPQHELARRQMESFSGMLAFTAEDGPALARHFADRLEVFHYAVSLGHHRSLIFWVGTDELQEHSFRLDAEHLERYRDWAGDGVFRVSVGLEDTGDVVDDLLRALDG